MLTSIIDIMIIVSLFIWREAIGPTCERDDMWRVWYSLINHVHLGLL